ncbi:MAG: hypothetical protein QG671_296 [Actinomycetota bacterium]|nr:hypothetical protein [Actinomycetota bacterium]
MASNLDCVGLRVRDQDGFTELVGDALRSAQPLGSRDGVDVVRWQDAGGARLVFGLRGGKVLDLLPSFAAEPGAQLSGLVMATDEVATAAVVDESGEQLTSLALEPEQRRLLPADQVHCAATVIALGVEVGVFSDADAFGASAASLLSERDSGSEPPADYIANGWTWPPRMAAESFISYGVFGASTDATAHAQIAGTVLAASLRRTMLTGQEFITARVRTAGFETDVCLSAHEHQEVPIPGQVIAGTVFLVGDLAWASDAEAPARRRHFLGWGRK